MTHRLRIQNAGVLFHVINRGNGRQTIFRDEEDFEYYQRLLWRYKQKFTLQIYHFILMSNHIHLLLETTKANTISGFMKGLTVAYTRYFNKKYQCVGHAWQGRFQSIPIETVSYYLRCARYIELNPLRAGIVSHPKEYPWSSYLFFTGEKSCIWLDTHQVLKEFSGYSYKYFVESDIPKPLVHQSECFSSLPVYGDENFVRTFEI